MNHIRAAMPTLIPKSFMLAPHLKAGAAGVGAAAEEFAEILTVLVLDLLMLGAKKTLFDVLDPSSGEDTGRTEAPITRTGAITDFELRAEDILASEGFIVKAMATSSR